MVTGDTGNLADFNYEEVAMVCPVCGELTVRVPRPVPPDGGSAFKWHRSKWPDFNIACTACGWNVDVVQGYPDWGVATTGHPEDIAFRCKVCRLWTRATYGSVRLSARGLAPNPGAAADDDENGPALEPDAFEPDSEGGDE